MLNTPFSPWPNFSKEEAEAAKNIILSNKVNYWTGQEGRNFEKEFAEYTDCKYSVALGNGTQALDLALIALGVGDGDEVIVTPRTFLASVSSVVIAGAKPVFVDVDRDSQNIEAENIKGAITEKTKAVIVVHLAGRSADMDPIMELAQLHGFYVIEDCAQAHGAKYKERSVGSIGHIGAWSFCQDKIMTTGGEGGMVTTNDEKLWRKMWSYKDHGKSYEAVYEREHPAGFRWLHESFGTNWRMTEVQAAIGRIQLTRMHWWMEKRQNNAAAITAVCSEFNCVRTPTVPEYIEHACYKHYCFVEPKNLAKGWTRDRIVNEIVERGLPCMQGSCSEVYLERAFDGTGFRPSERLPVAKELGETSLMFLVHPTLTKKEVEKTCSVIKDVLSQAQK
ncbi:DegT/DnrJ/EryC1/StrS family aminotransferase [Idiomarina abyssalis]|jgi:dTDP-4-amino-4,6-dideoxygalactose transaminase|uniref:DegT/DnrJ/EryC1/StrS family aminotransferase n=1 Tax=Idiomarina abyssalis TaxID=86102 RepID=UPI0006C8D831|nr:DegT/DnrJ/EryC1/StrS aminotransferase family protein [Idiomarina abyssalis]KPD20481.1 aminotransferase [Idiomarina abyssalis]SFT69455.1 dTDP-4-amino-4,6-dideoxygalactose transaminase [Idiomarina abyssalis]